MSSDTLYLFRDTPIHSVFSEDVGEGKGTTDPFVEVPRSDLQEIGIDPILLYLGESYSVHLEGKFSLASKVKEKVFFPFCYHYLSIQISYL